MALKAVVLGAGEGSRMKAACPKVLHRVAGRPLIQWVLDAVAPLEPAQTVVVVKPDADQVAAMLPDRASPVVQARQLGTAHALQVALGVFSLEADDHILVVPADTPLITTDTLGRMARLHRTTGAAATCVTAAMDDPTGYGRVVRDGWGRVRRIVEHADCTTSEREIQEINGGIYMFDGEYIRDALDHVEQNNAQSEYYLPDAVSILGEEGHSIAAFRTTAEELSGVNTQGQLAGAAAIMRRRINEAWMREGVWMLDPDRVYIDAGVDLAAGVRLYPGVHLEGGARVRSGARIGPDVFLEDTEVGEGARIWYSALRGACVGPGAEVGPYASLRPGARLGGDSKAGTFVEVKNSVVGQGAKVPHLSYVGDADIGAGANLGAGSITANYDWLAKHRTKVGRGAQIGCNTVLVAPVEVGEGAYTAAGSAITRDVPEGALGVERSAQREVADYAERRGEQGGTG